MIASGASRRKSLGRFSVPLATRKHEAVLILVCASSVANPKTARSAQRAAPPRDPTTRS